MADQGAAELVVLAQGQEEDEVLPTRTEDVGPPILSGDEGLPVFHKATVEGEAEIAEAGVALSVPEERSSCGGAPLL